VLTTPDSALRLCAARLYYVYVVTKLRLQNVYDEIGWSVCLSDIAYNNCYATENKKK